MNHDEIRFRVLFNLYSSHFAGKVKNWMHIDDVIDEAGLKEADRNMVMGDVVYLKEKHLIEIRGMAYSDESATVPERMRITAYGIDSIEEIVSEQTRKEQEYRSWHRGMGAALANPEVRKMVKEVKKEAGGVFSRRAGWGF